jgi:hypothetical protein
MKPQPAAAAFFWVVRVRPRPSACQRTIGRARMLQQDRERSEGARTLAKTNYSFEKRQRELAKKKKQEEKRQRKANRDSGATPPGEDAASPAPDPQPAKTG